MSDEHKQASGMEEVQHASFAAARAAELQQQPQGSAQATVTRLHQAATSVAATSAPAANKAGQQSQPATKTQRKRRGLQEDEWRVLLRGDRLRQFQKFMVALAQKGMEHVILSIMSTEQTENDMLQEDEAMTPPPPPVHELFLRAYMPDFTVVAQALFVVDQLVLGKTLQQSESPVNIEVWLDALAVKATFKYFLSSKDIDTLLLKGFVTKPDEVFLFTDVAAANHALAPSGEDVVIGNDGGGGGGDSTALIQRGRQKQCIRVSDPDAETMARLTALDDASFGYMVLEVPAARLATQLRGLKTQDYRQVTLTVSATPLPPAGGEAGPIILQLQYEATQDAKRSVHVDKYPLLVGVEPDGVIQVQELLTSSMADVVATIQARQPAGAPPLALKTLWSITLPVLRFHDVLKSFGNIDRLQLQCCSAGTPTQDPDLPVRAVPELLAQGRALKVTASLDNVYLLQKRLQAQRE